MPDNAALQDGPTKQLARWIASLEPDRIPEPVRKSIRLLTLDTLGAALHGRTQPWSQAVTTWAERQPPAPGDGLASRWGAAAPGLRASEAALVNGTAAHAFELDDFHNAKVHPGAVVVPAVLALAEARGLSGARVLSAIATGYEVMVRLSLALGPSQAKGRGWHLTGICGSVAAAAAAAHLLGFDETRTAWALGLGGTQSAGLFAFTADGSMSKRLHTGRSAQSGVMAAELAELDFSGPTRLFEAADGGWLKTFCDESSPEPLLDALGSAWRSAETSFKPYACCGSLHAHIDAALALRPHWTPETPVKVGVARVVDVQCGYAYEEGSALNAQLSAQYCVAAALADGAVLPRQFGEARLADAGLTALAQRIDVVHDPALDALYPERFAGWVEIGDGEGARRESVENPSGNPANPRWEAALLGKFRTLAGPLGPEGAAEALERGILAIETLPAGELADRLARFAANGKAG